MINIIRGGGYNASFCLRETRDIVQISIDNKKINCLNSNQSCGSNYIFSCHLPCGMTTETDVKIPGKILKISWIDVPNPIFKLPSSKQLYKTGDNLTIESHLKMLSLLSADQINVLFSRNISCSKKWIVSTLIICNLNNSDLEKNKKETVNVTVEYGLKCSGSFFIGNISVNYEDGNDINITWIVLMSVLIIVSLSIMFCFMKSRRNNWNETSVKVAIQLRKQETLFYNIQQKTFFEYQNVIRSFSNIGKLTPRYLLSFHDYMITIFSVKIKLALDDCMNQDLEDFKTIIMNKDTLLEWINKVERNCRIKEKSLVASFLTIHLFSYPAYFLDIMKTLITKLATELKEKNEEDLLFARSEYIIEKMVGNWLSLCLYENIKNGELGHRFFNLCRSIKCKIESGLVDAYTNKAKYALTFDNLLLGDLNYSKLTIIVQVRIDLNMMNASAYPIKIEYDDLQVEVLSLDSISQVKAKIIDKAVTVYVESEDLEPLEDKVDMCIGKVDENKYKLQFMNNNIKIDLKDFDNTSIVLDKSRKFIAVNTMKHYNMKSNMKFFLSPADLEEAVSVFTSAKQSFYLDKEIPIHLQMPSNIDDDEVIQYKSTQFLFDPIIENCNRDSYLFMLMATKKSLKPLIDAFIQIITNWKPKKKTRISTRMNSTYFSTNSLMSSLNGKIQCSELEARYLKPIYYFFQILDEIGNSLFIQPEIIERWKSKSFIRQVWSNLIRNPNFVFSINLSESMFGSLKTISNMLLDACSTVSNANPSSIDLPVIKQLFLTDVKKKYSVWWKSFITLAQEVSNEDIQKIMNEIVETNFVDKFKISSLRSLRMLSKTIVITSLGKSIEDCDGTLESFADQSYPD